MTATQIKTWTAADYVLFSDINAEFANIYSALNSGVATLIADNSITDDKLTAGASPATYFGELFSDGAVIAGGLAYASKSGLDVTITAGTAYVLQTSSDPDKLIRVAFASTQTFTVLDNTTNYLDLGSDGVIDVTQSSTAAADHMRILKVIAASAVITGTPSDEADRTFPDNTLPPGYKNGIQLTCASATEVVIAADFTIIDSTDVYALNSTSAITLDITNSVGALGLDQGSEASSTWYAVVVIGDSTSVLPASAVLVTAANYPSSITLPSGYDIYRRVGWARNDGSSDFLQFIQFDNKVQYEEAIKAVSNSTATTFTGTSLTSYVPTTSRIGHLHGDCDINSVASDLVFRTTGSGATTGINIANQVSNAGGHIEMWLDTSQSFDFKGVSDIQAIDIFVYGYTDDLERNL